MVDACYYSLIRRTEDGKFSACVPDLPGVTAVAATENEVIRQISRDARQHLHELVLSGRTAPSPTRPDEFPCACEGTCREHRHLLLILG